MKVQYSSNNSGGSWWLSDEDWFNLERSGWTIEWIKNKEVMGRKMDRWLGCLAKEATIDCETPGEAMKLFEKVTGQNVSDEGCNCCGAPHTFYWGRAIDDSLPKDSEYGYASGEACLEHLFPGSEKLNLREAYEKLIGN